MWIAKKERLGVTHETNTEYSLNTTATIDFYVATVVVAYSIPNRPS